MSKVDFTKPVRSVGADVKKLRVIAFHNEKALIGTLLDQFFATSDGSVMDYGGFKQAWTLENIPEAPVDWSQGVLDNPLKVPWKAINTNNNGGGCYIKCGEKDFYIYSKHPHLIEPTITDPNIYQYDNQWPIPAEALAKLAELTKDDLPEGVELKNTVDYEQSSAYCFVDGKIVGMICHDSSLKTGFVPETLLEEAIYKHKRSSEATYTWSDLVRIRDEFRAKRKAVKVEMKIEPEKDLSILTVDYVKRKDITSCTVTTSGLAAEVGGK